MASDAKSRTYTIYTDRTTYSWRERQLAEASQGLTAEERRATYQVQAEIAHALITQYSGKALRVVTAVSHLP